MGTLFFVLYVLFWIVAIAVLAYVLYFVIRKGVGGGIIDARRREREDEAIASLNDAPNEQ